MTSDEKSQLLLDVMHKCTAVLSEKDERIALLAGALFDCVMWMEKNHEMPSYSEIIANARAVLENHA